MNKKLIITGLSAISLLVIILAMVLWTHSDKYQIKKHLEDSIEMRVLYDDKKIDNVKIDNNTLTIDLDVGQVDNTTEIVMYTHSILAVLQDYDLDDTIYHIEVNAREGGYTKFSLSMETKVFLLTNWNEKNLMDYYNPLYDTDMIDHKFYN